jgi:FAD/FMN-containing dehydrogenase
MGPLVWRGDSGYERARSGAVWNARKPARFPDVIVQAKSDHDVVEAVAFARSQGLKIAVRGGGHSMCGSPVRDGGLLIDLSQLREMTIDALSRTAMVQPAITSRDLAAALAARGLAFPVGHCGSVPMSGYLLAGGLGWNMGTWGPACFSVDAVEAVTADGQLVTAAEGQNDDLFWAARGAGPGFFAVATAFHVRVYPLPSEIRTSAYVYPLTVAPELPPTVEMMVRLMNAPPNSGLVPGAKAVSVTAAAFAHSEAEAERCLALLETCPSKSQQLMAITNQPSSFAQLHGMLDGLLPEGRRYAEDAVWSSADVATVLPLLAEEFVRAPSQHSMVMAATPRPRPPEALVPDAAFSSGGTTFLLCYAVWDDEVDDDVNERWLRGLVRSMQPTTVGHYVAEADLLADRSRARRSFAPSNWDRLRSMKRQLDPDDLFHSFLDPGHDAAGPSERIDALRRSR